MDLVGEIIPPRSRVILHTGMGRAPQMGLGWGGIVYNVKVGNPCFGWARGEGGARGIRGRSRQRPGEGLLHELLSRL